MKSSRFSFATKVSLIYAITGGLWILTSDLISARSFSDAQILTTIQIYKGWIFILITAIALFLLIHNKEQSKQEAEQNYRSLFETAVEGIFRSSPNGQYLTVNPAMANIYGYSSPEEMLETVKDIGTQIHLNEESHRRFIIILDKEGVVERYEAQNLRKDGSLIWTSTNARAIRDANGNILFYEGFVTDITKRKITEIALRETQAQYRAVIEQMPAAVYTDIPDPYSSNYFSSPQILEITGYSPGEWRANPELWINITHPDDRLRVLAENERTNLSRQPFNVEYRIIARDGHVVWVHDMATLICDEDGRPLYWQGILLDISKQKKTQEALLRREAILEAVGFTAEQFLKSPSWEDCIDQVLGHLGITVQASRVYVFKKHLSAENDILISQLFEWCNQGIEPQIHNQTLQNMNFEEAGYSRWITLFNDGLPAYGIVRELPPEEQVEFQREGILSIICFPIQVGYDWWGFIGFDDCCEEREWSAVEIEALRIAVSTLGAAIKRKSSEQALQRQLKELTILHAVALAESSAQNTDELIQRTTDIIGDTLYSDNCGILLLDRSGEMLQPHYSYRGTSPDVLAKKYPITKGISGKVVTSRETIRTGDISKDRDYYEVTTEIRSELCVPISSGERIIGVINVESRQPDAFTDDDERLLNTIAGGMTTALEKLQLFELEKKRRKAADSLREATAALTSSVEPRRVFDVILDTVLKLVACKSASIELIEGDTVEIVAERGLPLEHQYVGIRYPSQSRNWNIDLWNPIIIPDVHQDDRFEKLPGTEYIRSWMGVPLITQDKLLGYLNLDSDVTDFFADEQAALAQTFANQAAIAIENARTFQEERRRTKIIEALADIANEITTTGEIDALLDKVARRTLDLLKASHVAIFLLQDDNITIKPVTAQGTFRKEILSHPLKLGEGITGDIILTGKSQIINDTTNDPRRVKVPGTSDEDGILETMMSSPLILRGKPIGAINAWRLRSDELFNQSELNFLISIAHQTSISIEAGRLLQETGQRAQEAAAIAEVGRDISATLQLDLVLERIAVYAKELLKSETSAVYLAEPGSALLRAIAAVGIESDEIKNFPVQIGTGIVGNIAKSKIGEIVNDTAKDPRTIVVTGTEMVPYEHIMGVPVLSKDKLTGLLVVWRTGYGLDFKQSDLDFLTGLAQQAAVAIENARLFQAEQKRRQEAESLRNAAIAITSTLEPKQVLDTILVALQEVIPYDSASILQLTGEHVRLTAGKGLPHPELALNQAFPASNKLVMEMNQNKQPIIIEDCMKDSRFEKWAAADYVRGWMGIPLITRGQVIGYITMDSFTPCAFDENAAMLAQIFAHQAAAAMDNARLYTETRQRLEELEVVSRISFALRVAKDSDEMLPILLDEIKHSMDTDSIAIWLYNSENNELIQKAGSGNFQNLPKPNFRPNDGIVGQVFTTGEIYVSPDFSKDPMVHPENVPAFGKDWGGVSVPIRTASETIGVLTVAVASSSVIESHHIRLLTTIAEIAGNAIYRSDLFERNEKQIRRLTTLREIDIAISTSFDLRVTLDILSEHLLTKMGVSATAILTLSTDNQILNYFSGAGFRNQDIFRKSLQANEGLAGQVLVAQNDLYIENLNQQTKYVYPNIVAREGFVSYFGMPLRSKGLIRGVLETYFRTHFVPNSDWLDFLHTLAGQATIAIDNAQLFENLQRSNQGLSLAYDKTLEGWGKALELRDKETEGHTRRVSELTLRLARQIGIPEPELIHIRRGALLHDIGKMGVPDSILRKEGPLTSEEWIEMRKHPQYAYDLLSPIPYLRASLDIPYSHHEWWDGSGYPSGLKEEKIPLSARIFAVVDVWDALLSNRPYRRPWPKSKVFKYLRDLSGKQFDPEIVKTFFEMMRHDNYVSGHEKKLSEKRTRVAKPIQKES